MAVRDILLVISLYRMILCEIGDDSAMTTEEYLIARTKPNWKFWNSIPMDSFDYVNKIHPLKQKIVKEIVDAAKEDSYVNRLIIFGSSIRYDCNVTSDLDICIDWTESCSDEDGVLKPFTRHMYSIITKVTHGNVDVVPYEFLDNMLITDAVLQGVTVYERHVF